MVCRIASLFYVVCCVRCVSATTVLSEKEKDLEGRIHGQEPDHISSIVLVEEGVVLHERLLFRIKTLRTGWNRG
jgi:hypothetical protein